MGKKLKLAGTSVVSAALLLGTAAFLPPALQVQAEAVTEAEEAVSEAVTEAEEMPAEVVTEAEEASAETAAEGEEMPAETESETGVQAKDLEEYTHLTVGTTTAFDGAFFTDMWGNATSDLDVRELIHGCSLAEWEPEEGTYGIDESVVSSVTVTQNQEGDHIWLITLYDDLLYSDGTPITAWDYAFSILLSASPQAAAIGADVITPEYLEGYEAWINGDAPCLAGVRVLGDQLLQFTIRSEYLPFFYEAALLNFCPYPIGVIAPGCVVADSGEGIAIVNEDEKILEPLFTEELLEQTILDPESGYRSHPSVTSGPYVLTDYDGTKAEFEINPYFKGDSEGRLPRIDRLTYQVVENADMVDLLADGQVDLLNKCVSADALSSGMKLVGDDDRFAMQNYARSGLTMISFDCGKDTVRSDAVRQAIAYCLDRDLLTKDYVANFGIRSDGYYGVGQWMYQIVNGTLPYPGAENAQGGQAGSDEQSAQGAGDPDAVAAQWEELSLDGVQLYEFDPLQAQALLIADGWVLNDDGEEFDPEKDSVRCKIIEVQDEVQTGAQDETEDEAQTEAQAGVMAEQDTQKLVALELTLGVPAGSRILESLDEAFIQPLAQVGILVQVKELAPDDLLHEFYGQTERTCDMLYLATNFDVLFDPSDDFPTLDDPQLYELSQDLIHTQPGDVLTYCQKWVRFQERFAQVLPVIPVYSNVYFDFYTRALHDYQITSNVSWGQVILGSYLSDIETEDAQEAESETETEELGENEIYLDD